MCGIDTSSVFESDGKKRQCVQCTCFFSGQYILVEIGGYEGYLCSNECVLGWYDPQRSRNWDKAPDPLPRFPSKGKSNS